MSSPHLGKSPARLRFEDLSRGPLQTLNRVPKALVVIGMAATLLGGLLAPAVVGVPLLVVLALFLGWLVALSWPILAPGPRLMRVVTVGLVLFAAWMRASGR
jgi:hypothetical protein